MPDPAATTMESHQRPGPALSATSDTPLEKPPAPALSASAQPKTVADVVKAPKTDAKAVAKAEDEAKPDAKDEDGKPAKKADDAEGDEAAAKKDKTDAAIKGEITKERNRRRAAEEKAAGLTAQLTAALKSVEQLTALSSKEAAAKVNQDDPRPKRETFDDPSKYDDALVSWSSRQATRVAKAEAEADRLATEEKAATERASKETTDANAALQKQWAKQKEAALEEFPDYEEVAERDDLPISIPMAHAIMNSDNGPKVAYHLGKHPEEAERIAALSPLKQAIEIGKLSVKLETKPAPATKAPAPVKPLGARSTAAGKTADEESMSEYAARRQRELAATSRRGVPA